MKSPLFIIKGRFKFDSKFSLYLINNYVDQYYFCTVISYFPFFIPHVGEEYLKKTAQYDRYNNLFTCHDQNCRSNMN